MKFVYLVLLFTLYIPSLSTAQSVLSKHLVFEEKKNIDSLERLATRKKSPTVAYLTLLLNIENSRLRYKPTSFGNDLEQIRALAIRLKNLDGIASYHYFMGVKAIAFSQDYKTAFSYYTKALEEYKSTRDTFSIIKTNIELSKLNLNQSGKVTGSLDQMLAYAREAVRVARLTKNPEAIVRSMHNEALYYYGSKHRDLKKLETMLLGILKITDGNPDLADLQGLYQIDLGQVYAERGDYQKAIKLFEKALENEASIVSPHNRYILFVNASETYINLKKYEPARLYALKALAIARQYTNPEQLETTYLLLEHLYSETGNLRQALTYARLIRTLSDSLSELDKVQKLNELQVKYQTEKKEQANQLLKQQNKFIQAENRYVQQQNRQYLIGFIIALLAVILIVILSVYLKRSNRKLLATNRELDHLTNAQKRFFSIIAHDLRTPITTFTGLFDVAGYYLKTNQLDRLKVVSQHIDKASLKVDQLLRNLLQYAQLDQRKGSFATQSARLKPLVDDVLDIYEIVASGRDISYVSSCPEELTILGDPDDISLVLRNLVDNAMKSLDPGGTLTVKAEAISEKQVKLMVHDNGKGIDASMLQHLNAVFSQKESGFVGEQGLGLGMLLVNDAVKRMGGTVSIESQQAGYTVVSVYLPVGFHVPSQTPVAVLQP